MPNWCDNNLLVTGNQQDLERFIAESFSKDDYGKTQFDFEKIVPIGETKDWYELHWQQWGTKWNAVDTNLDATFHDAESSVSLWFETAWSPPIPIMEALTAQYPTLSFTLRYNEGGVGFRGRFESVEGEILIDECWDMTTDDLVELGYLDPEEVLF